MRLDEKLKAQSSTEQVQSVPAVAVPPIAGENPNNVRVQERVAADTVKVEALPKLTKKHVDFLKSAGCPVATIKAAEEYLVTLAPEDRKSFFEAFDAAQVQKEPASAPVGNQTPVKGNPAPPPTWGK
jgi:hypothetical protein